MGALGPFLGQSCLGEAFFTKGWTSPSEGSFSYYRSKLSNVLHASELPKRHPGIRAYSVDLGWVDTKIHGMTLPGLLGWMRPPAKGASPIVYAATAAPGDIKIEGGLIDPWGFAHPPFELEGRLGMAPHDHLAGHLAARLWDFSAGVMKEKGPGQQV